MAALTTGRRTPKRASSASEMLSADCAASQTFFKGGMVQLNAAGYAVPASSGTGKKMLGVLPDQNEGVPTESINSSATLGATKIRVERTTALLNNSGTNPVVQANLLGLVYAEDDNTVGSLATGFSPAGRAIALEPATGPSGAGVWVELGNVAAP